LLISGIVRSRSKGRRAKGLTKAPREARAGCRRRIGAGKCGQIGLGARLMTMARARSTGRCVWPVLDSYRSTLDRCTLMQSRRVPHSQPCLQYCGAKLSPRTSLLRYGRVAHTLGRKTTALQNQGEQLNVQHMLKDFFISQQTQTLLFSSDGKTEPGGDEKDLETATETVMMAALEKKLGGHFSRRPTLPASQPLLIVISGPSGVGKDAVIARLQEVRREMHFVVTATTREKRVGEVDGKDYIFMDKPKFEELIERNELLEHALVYGDYKGIPKQQVRKALGKGTDVVLRLDVQGAATIRKLIPESLSIFLVAENERALVRRLLARKTEPLDSALVRVETARKETQRIGEFDYVVENPSGKLEETVQKICSIIEAEKLRMNKKRIKI